MEHIRQKEDEEGSAPSFTTRNKVVIPQGADSAARPLSVDEVQLNHSKAIPDLIVLLGFGVLVLALTYAFNIFERPLEWFWQHKQTIADELFGTLFVLSPAFAIFAHRRWKEVRLLYDEVDKRVQRRTADLAKSNEALRLEITERKRAESALEHKQAELQMIVDTVPAMIFYKDRQHRLLRVNAAAVRAHGRPAEDLVGKTDAELGLPQAEQYVRDEEEIAARGQPKSNIIEPVLTATGTRWFQTDKFPIMPSLNSICQDTVLNALSLL